MAEARYVVSSTLPRDTVWEFCEVPSNWAELIPGYCSHKALDEQRSEWEVKVDLGPFTRLVIAEVTVLEIMRPERVRLELKGSDATPFTGVAEVRADEAADRTSISIEITMTPTGPLGPVVNAIAAPVLPRVTEEFANALIRKFEGGA